MKILTLLLLLLTFQSFACDKAVGSKQDVYAFIEYQQGSQKTYSIVIPKMLRANNRKELSYVAAYVEDEFNFPLKYWAQDNKDIYVSSVTINDDMLNKIKIHVQYNSVDATGKFVYNLCGSEGGSYELNKIIKSEKNG